MDSYVVLLPVMDNSELERRKDICRGCDRLRAARGAVWCATKQRRPDGRYCEPYAAGEYRQRLLDPHGCERWSDTMRESAFDTTAFSELVAGRSVAVVGNAPTAANYDHAAAIDASDVVIRFNRFSLDYPNVGTKTDVIAVPACCGPAYPSRAILERSSPRLVLLVPPKLDGIESHLDRIRGYDRGLLPINYFGRLTRETGARPTTGLAVVCFLLDRCRPKSIYLTGFSFARLKKDHYYPGVAYSYGVHDPLKDLHTYARRHRPDLVAVDPHIHRRLYATQPADELAGWRRRGGKPYSAPHRWLYEQVTRRVKGRRVLEVGAGIGDGVERLLAAGCQVTAIEPHAPTCEHLAARFPNVDVRSVGLLEYDGPAVEEAVCLEVVEHLAAVEVHPFLRRLRELCGRVWLSSPDRREHTHGRRTPYEWCLALRAAGFSPRKTRTQKWAVLIEAD